MKLPIYQVDAFTSRLFGGNPAAVVILEEWLPDRTLQDIAAENNLSETAFVVPRAEPFRLRWFTPRVEVDLCGHATLATAFVLFETGRVRGDVVRFETQSGALAVQRADGLLSMDFPARPASPVACTNEIRATLGAEPREVHLARDLMVVFDDERDVAALEPNLDGIAALDAFAVIVTAPGREADFVSRFFAPRAGVPEDPVTGSAHSTLIPYWSARLQKKKLRAFQLSKRGGEILCEDRGERVVIGGRAIEYMRGEIILDETRR
jgi:PhzF family phenazine biosynthesis protein